MLIKVTIFGFVALACGLIVADMLAQLGRNAQELSYTRAMVAGMVAENAPVYLKMTQHEYNDALATENRYNVTYDPLELKAYIALRQKYLTSSSEVSHGK